MPAPTPSFIVHVDDADPRLLLPNGSKSAPFLWVEKMSRRKAERDNTMREEIAPANPESAKEMLARLMTDHAQFENPYGEGWSF